jgi:hypothetical protein
VRARILAAVLLVMSISGLAAGAAAGQDSGVPLRNSDVIQMMKSGLGRRTIVLLIRQSQCNFDTSPQAMMKLKKAGVSDDVLNAMLTAERTTTTSAEATDDALMLKAANAFGPLDQATKIQAIRWVGSVTQTAGGGTTSFEEERLEVYPDRVYLSMRSPAGATRKLVVTPDFGYQSADRMASAVRAATAEAYRQQVRFDPPYVAQHLGDYLLIEQGGKEKDGAAAAEVVKISSKGVEHVWTIDAQTGRVASVRFKTPQGDVEKEYSDYRDVGSLTLPFKWRTTEGGRTTETTVSKYEVNPVVDEGLFQPQSNMSALSLRVLQSESVHYAQQMDNDISGAVNCQISESAPAKISVAASLLDDPVFAEDAGGSNLKMTCNSWDTTKFFSRVLNAMLVASSDGNAYVIACDKGWKWSKCVPLAAGQVFNASRTEKGIEVLGVNAKGKDQAATYSILMTKPLQ